MTSFENNLLNIRLTDISSPSTDEFWSMLQKSWTFDDPSDRCAKLKKATLKHIRSGRSHPDVSGKWAESGSTSQSELDYLFDIVFGGRPTTRQERILSVLLGFEDLHRFEEIAFASWQSGAELGITPGAPASAFWTDLRNWCEGFELSAPQVSWLLHCALAAPNWSRLETTGPWSSDARTQFVLRILTQLTSVFALHKGDGLQSAVLNKCQELFRLELLASRFELPSEFLPRVLLLVEGATESILLPHFAALLDADLQEFGIMIVPAGGAKQVAKRYFQWRDLVSIPIVSLFDRDAGEQIEVVRDALRDFDQLFVFESGEFEDTFELSAFVHHINFYLANIEGSPKGITIADFQVGKPRKTVLNKLWRERSLGDFDKVAFAHSLKESITDVSQLPREVLSLLNTVRELSTKSERKKL